MRGVHDLGGTNSTIKGARQKPTYLALYHPRDSLDHEVLLESGTPSEPPIVAIKTYPHRIDFFRLPVMDPGTYIRW